MTKNGNENFLLKDNIKKMETEQKLKNEGIIFQRRILSHKKDNKTISQKSTNSKKDLSIKLSEQYIKRNKNNINTSYINNIPFYSMRAKKSSLTTKLNQRSINDVPKGNIKKNNSFKTASINKKNCSPIPALNNNKKKIIKANSCKRYKNNTNRKSLNIIGFNNRNFLFSGGLSPRTTLCKIENGHISPIERSKYYLNTNMERNSRYEKYKFNFKRWDKLAINKQCDKFPNNMNNKLYDSQNNINNGKDKENNGLNNNQNRININDNGIQEIVIKNIKKNKKLGINDIPLNRKKYKTKENTNNSSASNKYTIFNYYNQIQNSALNKEENNIFIEEAQNGLKFDQMKSIENNNKIKVNNCDFKKYKPSRKSYSCEKVCDENIQVRSPASFTEFDIKNKKIFPKTKESSHHFVNKSLILKRNNFNLDNMNKGIYRNEFHSIKQNYNTEMMNEQLIKIKNNKLEDFIKDDKINIYNKREIVINKYSDKDNNISKEHKMRNKYIDMKEDIFNSNTDISHEKEKCLNNYTFDNKYEIDSEVSFKFLRNNNNIFDSNNTNITYNSISNNIPQNYTEEIPLNYSLRQKIFTKKIIGAINLRHNNVNKNNNKNVEDKNNISKNTINNTSRNNNIIENKENIGNNVMFINNKFNGDYMELAKICVNQEKIISDLVKNVQHLNNKICDKDLCINELNNQLYSIKYDLLNTLQKTNGK